MNVELIQFLNVDEQQKIFQNLNNSKLSALESEFLSQSLTASTNQRHHWSENVLQVCTLLRLKSVSASEFLRDYCMKLPSKTTIRSGLCKLQVGEGFLEINLLAAANVIGSGPASLLFDEVSLSEDTWIGSDGEVKGFSSENPDKLIKNGCVFMIQSLKSGKSCSIGWYGTSTINAKILVNYIEKAITLVHYVTPQIIICALVADGHASNRAAFNLLIKLYGQAGNNFFEIILKDGSRSKVFIFSC